MPGQRIEFPAVDWWIHNAERDIAQTQATIKKLAGEGHEVDDAISHLATMLSALQNLKNR
jgi:hypothetical protein